ncbi:hypothetical protein K450DRAFT_244421 [Umbelopsis ramanniana AG]|uniref:Uncharacterized protein n=1 Tax=Umbelopsis ramanniana AG TaxID=1314678 RepID=A0AAD5E932_UMBRA|nr:uncharacterized protein K450DRAFT_244421 [Umbelopsis ramanniana AG]KAI8578982.1 hypothetical protein K450DRAFT_244421 [Umbelopsis ramanniana AG]
MIRYATFYSTSIQRHIRWLTFVTNYIFFYLSLTEVLRTLRSYATSSSPNFPR